MNNGDRVRGHIGGHIGSAYAQMLAAVLAGAGLTLEDLPGGAGIAALARRGPVLPVGPWRDLLDAAATRLGAPDLGLRIGRAFEIGHLGLLGYALQSCPTLGAALLRLQRYERLVNDINRLSWHLDGDRIVLEWGDERGRPGPLVDEAAVAALVQATRQITARPDLVPDLIAFINPPPADLAPYRAFFGHEPRFAEARTRMVFPQAWLALPLDRHDPVLADLLAAQVETLLAALPAEADVAQQVRRALAHGLGREGATLEAVAAALALSPRTLHRRLEAAGTSFRALFEDTRLHLAREYLRDPRLSLSDVAGLLGFSEQSAFTRAFRRWTGSGPKAWRLRQR
ncbi:AraC family transcriptional regulator [Zavarzinia compransoris]|uniref:AraC family transcriptional regulator n=1 Tax=Zavarzinia compransoris TaxID=1264899 RepID=A0A317EBW9_9PROT|nr:AraC family transcriptional regulator [Zavarzinia compransoris]PWR23794.1 AraC family transcriptional regulator [Zavarzinia compransoris]TDP48026.1 AraC family transcriptional regulator [Zavarzinia compransoris]